MVYPADHIEWPERLIVADDIELRPLRESDGAALFDVVDRNRAHLRRWLPWVDGNQELTDTMSFIRLMHVQFAEKTGLTFGIFLHAQPVGVLTLRSLDWSNHSGEIGYWLAEAHQGKGIMVRSCRAMISHAFAKLGLHRIVIRCAVGNTRSAAIPERLGFVREGLARGAEWLNGNFVDLTVYSMLSTEWKDK